MLLSIIIVNYNVKYFVEQCLRSVYRAIDGMEAEVFVVDNHSRDGSVAYLRERFPQVTLIDSNHNLGFARANNMAIRQAEGKYVLLLNPDTFVGEDSIRRVVEWMETHPQAGGAGAMMHNADGERAMESRRALPTPMVSLQKMLGRSKRYYMSHLSWDEPGRIEVMSGAFCMLRREVLQRVGLLDEDFFMYGEDIDLSYRITKGGYENWYVPAPIVHYKGESTHKSSFRYVHVFYQAMLIFFRKHYSHLSLLVTLPIKVAIYVRALIALVGMLSYRMRRSLGFVTRQDQQRPFVFVGSPQMLDECRTLARHKALTASFVGSLSELADVGNGADVRECTDTRDCTIVYDTDHFSFSAIISDMHQHHRGLCDLGTYSTHTHVLITPTEVITL